MEAMQETLAETDQSASPSAVGVGRLERRLAAGSLASFVSLLVTIGTAIVQVPLLLDAWGEETYGAWLLVTATYSLIVSLDVGHQNYVANKISMLGLHDVAACRRVLGSAVKAACVIGVAEVAVAVATVWSGVWSVWLPGESAMHIALRAQTGIVLITLTTWFAFLGSIGGILVRLYMAGGLYARSVWIGIAQRLVMFVGLSIAAVSGLSLVGATSVYLASGSLVCAYSFYDIRRKFPAYWPWWRGGSLIAGLRQAGLSLGLTATSVSDQCAAAGLLGISGSRVHAAGVATLGTLRTLSSSILQAAGVLVLPVGPDLSRFAASADHRKAAATLSVLWLISTAPLCLGVTVFGPLAEAVFKWWTRGALAFSVNLFALLALGALVRQWQSPMALFLFSANRMRAQVVISLIRTSSLILTLASGFYFTSDITIAGLAVVVSELVAAATTVAFVSLFLREIHGRLPRAAAATAALQVAISMGGVLCWISAPPLRQDVIAGCVIAHLVVWFLQWRMLPTEVKDRAMSLLGARLDSA
jgi:O-antigen/teichoic acid export membrane protein